MTSNLPYFQVQYGMFLSLLSSKKKVIIKTRLQQNMNQSKQQYFSRDTDCLSSNSTSGYFSKSLLAKEKQLSKNNMIQKIRQLQLILEKQQQRNKQEARINEKLTKKLKKKNQIFIGAIQYSSLQDNIFQQNIIISEKAKRQRHVRHQSNLTQFNGSLNTSQNYFHIYQKNLKEENSSKITKLNQNFVKEQLQYRNGFNKSKKIQFYNNRETIKTYQPNENQMNSLRKRKRYKSIDQIWDETR